MRRWLVRSVMILGILAWTMPTSFCQAMRDPVGRSGESAVPVETPVWEVEGHGKTELDAEQNALEKARDKVVEYLAEKYGDFGWTPSPGYLKQAKIATQSGEVSEEKLPLSGVIKKVQLTVQLTPDAIQKMLEQAREVRMGERQRLAARWLAGFVAVLLVLTGYLRLEDATKGYYTRLLRLAALAVLTVAGVCLWRL